MRASLTRSSLITKSRRLRRVKRVLNLGVKYLNPLLKRRKSLTKTSSIIRNSLLRYVINLSYSLKRS